MSQFDRLVLTDAGRILQAKAQTGVALQFTRIAVGSGYLPTGVEMETLEGLIQEEKSFEIIGISVIGDGTSKITARVTNEGVATGFYLREIGLFATDPDLGEILYCVGNAGDLVDFLPAAGNILVESVVNLVTIVGNATNVTAVLSSEVYVTKDDFTQLSTAVENQVADLSQSINEQMDDVPVKITSNAVSILSLSIELQIIKQSSIFGLADNVFVETFDSSEDILISNGNWDATEQKVYLI